MKDDTKEVLRIRVERVQRAYRHENVLFRIVWALAGITVLLAGLAMTVFPGPAFVVIPVGLAMLAAQFTWARRLLDVGIDRGVDAKRRMQRAGPTARLFTSLAGLCVVGAVAAFFLLR